MRARAERLIDLLAPKGVDVLLVSDLVNVRYLTAYSGSSGLALVGPRTRSFITDFRYVTQAADEVHPAFERHRASRDLLDAVEASLPEGRLRLGFEDAHMSVRDHARLRKRLPQRIELVGVTGLVETLRAVKEPEEVARIGAAAALADASFQAVLGDGLVGRTEREVALALEADMRARGARAPGFATIVAGGAHGALPHAQPRDVPIRSGHMVVIDWGAELNGYVSDCTRTIAAGAVDDQAREIYALVLEAQISGLNAVKAGRRGREVDAVAREVIERAGHGEEFGHGLGHGVGMDIHEAPRLSQRTDDQLRAGNVVTVEPGIYLAGKLGVRIEDLVVVTETSCQVLTSLPKELRVCD